MQVLYLWATRETLSVNIGLYYNMKTHTCMYTCTCTHKHTMLLLVLLLLQSCLTLCDPIDSSPPGSPIPGILQARTRVGCHFLLYCVKVKSESEVAQSRPTRSDPMDCSLPGSSIHGIFLGKSTAVACHCFLRNTQYLFTNQRTVWKLTIMINFNLVYWSFWALLLFYPVTRGLGRLEYLSYISGVLSQRWQPYSLQVCG